VTKSKDEAAQSSFLDDENPHATRGPEIPAIPSELSLQQQTSLIQEVQK